MREDELSICEGVGHAPHPHKTPVGSDGILPAGLVPARGHPGAVGNRGRRSSAMGDTDLFPDEPEQLSGAPCAGRATPYR